MEPTDHDLLIRMDQKLSDLCDQFGDVQREVKTKLSVSTFRWVIGLVITLLSISGFLNVILR